MSKIVEIQFDAVQSENVQALDLKVFNSRWKWPDWPMSERILIMWEKGWNLKI